MDIQQTWTILMLNEPTRFCRVCGLEQAHPQYGEDGCNPTFEICPCCGVEFGYEDSTLQGVLKFRIAWQQAGLSWFDVKEKPKDWIWEEQRKFIPRYFQ
jgi:hypothetical protein